MDKQEIWTEHYADLVTCLSTSKNILTKVTNELYSCRIISEEVKDEVHQSSNTREAANTLMTAVTRKVGIDPDRMENVIEVLLHYEDTKKIVSQLQSCLYDLNCAQGRISPQPEPSSFVSPNPIVDKLAAELWQKQPLKSRICSLQSKFTGLCVTVGADLRAADLIHVKLLVTSELANSLQARSYLSKIEKISDIGQLLTFLLEKSFCGYHNYMLIVTLAEKYGGENAKQQALAYKQQFSNFAKSAKLGDMVAALENDPQLCYSCPVGLPEVAFELEKSWRDASWSYFTSSLTTVFPTWFPKLLCGSIKHHCILVTFAAFPKYIPSIQSDLQDQKKNVQLVEMGIKVELHDSSASALPLSSEKVSRPSSDNTGMEHKLSQEEKACAQEDRVMVSDRATKGHSGIYIYVDDSNIWIEAKKFASQMSRTKKAEDHRVRVDIGKLTDIVAAGRPVEEGVLYGSEPPKIDTVWKKIESRGYRVKVHKRDAHSHRQRMINSQLVADVTERACITPEEERTTIILVTGDADAIPAIEKVIKYHGWSVEVYMWSTALSRDIKKLPQRYQNVAVRELDAYLSAVIFTNMKFDSTNVKLFPQVKSCGVVLKMKPDVFQKKIPTQSWCQQVEKIVQWPFQYYWIEEHGEDTNNLVVVFDIRRAKQGAVFNIESITQKLDSASLKFVDAVQTYNQYSGSSACHTFNNYIDSTVQ